MTVEHPLKNQKYITIIVSWTIIIILILFTFFGILNKGWIGGTDAQSYYMIGRSLYIDHDIDFTNEYHLTPHPEHLAAEPRRTKTGRIPNHHPIGYALLSQPFFFLADIITMSANHLLNLDLPRDGYRGIFGFVVPFSALIFAFWGSYLSYQIICNFFDKIRSALSISTMILSTSLLWYITGHLTMVHAHSFAIVTALIYYSMPLYNKNISQVSIFRFILIGCFFTLAVLTRLQNTVFAVVPITAILQNIIKNKYSQKEYVKLSVKIFVSVASAFMFFIPQILYWKIIYGSYFINSYAETGSVTFKILTPELVETFISTNHGLFLWHPITIFSCLGACFLFYRIKEYRLFLFMLAVCFLLTWYVVAAIDYSLANSFGNRGFDGSTLFFALGWAELLRHIGNKKNALLLCAVFILWNIQLLMQQRYLGWLPYNGEVPYLQVFKNYENLPKALEKILLKYF